MTAPQTTARGPETTLQTTLETVSPHNSTSDRSFSDVSTPRLRPTPSFHRRLPRFIRAKRSHRPPLALQDRDLDLLRTAYEYRLITTPQFLQLYRDDSKDGIYRRLQKLFHHGYLDRIGTNPNAPMLYALARRGADVLEVPVRKEVGDGYVPHQLMIGNARIALTLAANEEKLAFTWKTFDGRDSPVRPDGFFSLQFPDLPEGRNRAFFMLEADRSTMTRERFVQKLVAYQGWCDAGGHTAKLGIKNFRVLTVTRSEERLRSLVSAAAGSGGIRRDLARFWFTSETRFTPPSGSAILGAIWETADRPGHSQSLLP
ncbi:MAG TPA: replication-relaxation family protein [Methylomirabilota bacterium]|nr:replication-relaxation family protein [Methylomirabilota bacterium]